MDRFLAGSFLDPAESDWRVRGDEGGAEVEVDLPGFSRDEINVAVENDVLTVTTQQDDGRRPSVSRAFRLLDD